MFIDDASICYSRGDNSLLTNLGHRLMIHEINRLGCPHDVYLFDHIRRRDLPDYKLYLFLNTFRVHRGPASRGQASPPRWPRALLPPRRGVPQ